MKNEIVGTWYTTEYQQTFTNTFKHREMSLCLRGNALIHIDLIPELRFFLINEKIKKATWII